MLETPQQPACGVVDIITHGLGGVSPGCQIEWAADRSDAISRRDAIIQSGLFTADEVYVSTSPDSMDWGVGVRYSALTARYPLRDAIVTLMACYSAASPDWTGARTMVGLQGQRSTDFVVQVEDAIWKSLNGNCGVGGRTVSAAVAALPADSIRIYGDPATTLAPVIVAASVMSGTAYDCPQDADIEVTFFSDTELDTGVDAEDAVFVEGYAFTCSSAEWFGSNGLRVWLTPNCQDPGSVVISLDPHDVRSAALSTAELDGDGKDGPDDYRHGLALTNNPSVVVDGLHMNADSVSWNATCERDVVEYYLQGKQAPPDPWQVATPPLPPGAGIHRVARPAGYPILGLFERDAFGHELYYGIPGEGPIGPAADTSCPALEDLEAAVAALVSETPPPGWDPGRLSIVGEELVVFSPAEFVSDLTGFANWLRSWFGIETTIVPVESYGAPEARYAGIRDATRTFAASDGVQYFLLVGDASDWQYFDGPLTPQYWPSPQWEAARQAYFGQEGYPHGGDPHRNIIPTVVVADTSYQHSMARYQPYFFLGDANAYGDVEADPLSLPDVAIGRWPFWTRDEVLAAIAKTIRYLSSGYSEGDYQVGLFANNCSAVVGGGAYVNGMVGRLQTALAPLGWTQTLRTQDHDCERDACLEAALDVWQDDPACVFLVATGASRYDAAWFFTMPGFNINMLPNGSWTPVVVGASCGMGEFARTEDPRSGYQRPLMQRFLGAWDKGAIGWCGPSAGTWQVGNDAVATTIAEYFAADPTRPACESVRLALRDIVENADPVRDAAVVKTARSYGYFGFPLCPILHRGYASEVRERAPAELELSVAGGNPSGSPVELVLSLPERGRVLVRAYDVAGRIVSRVWDGTLDPGVHRMRWAGGADGERSVAAGVYWVRLECPAGQVTRRVTIVK